MNMNRKIPGRCAATLNKGMAFAMISFTLAWGAQAALPTDNWQNHRDTTWPGVYNPGNPVNYVNYTGTEYYVYTPKQLAQVAYLVNNGVNNFFGKSVLLMEDINLSEHWWTPIGWFREEGFGPQLQDLAYFFQGNFYGMGHTVSGLHLHEQISTSTSGLFGAIAGLHEPKAQQIEIKEHATVANLNIKVSYFVATKWYAGALAGGLFGVHVKEVNVSGTDSSSALYCVGDLFPPPDAKQVEAYEMYVGGLVGKAVDTHFQACKNTLPIFTSALQNQGILYFSGIHAGGIVGEITTGGSEWGWVGWDYDWDYFASSLVQYCVNTGAISSFPTTSKLEFDTENYNQFHGGYYVTRMGGIAGSANGAAALMVLIECRNEGALTDTVSCGVLGGIVAESRGGYGDNVLLINHCDNRGTILVDGLSDGAYGGGIVGCILGDWNSEIKNCSNSGTLTGESFAPLGGIAGYAMKTSIVNNWSSGDVTQLPPTVFGVGNMPVGGLIGVSYMNNIVNCYSSGEVTGDDAHGLIGYTGEGTIECCYWREKEWAGVDQPWPLYDGIGYYWDSDLYHCGTFGDAPGNYVTILVTLPSSPSILPVVPRSLLNFLNEGIVMGCGEGNYSEIPPQTWTLTGSLEAGGKGYPVFGGYFDDQSAVLVYLDSNGGTPTTPQEIWVYPWMPMPPPPPSPYFEIPTLGGHIFAGYTNAAGSIYYDAHMNSVQNWDKETGDTLYAVWVRTDNDFPNKVAYYGCGGLPGFQATISTGGKYVLPLVNPPSWPGHTFAGWVDCENNPITNETPFPSAASEPQHVYATWTTYAGQWLRISDIKVYPEFGLVALLWSPQQLPDPTATYKYTLHVSQDLTSSVWTPYEEWVPSGDAIWYVLTPYPSVREGQFLMPTSSFPGKSFFKVWAEKQ